MATKTLSQNVNQAISDFDSIKQAIIENGGEVPDGTPTSQYAELIEEIASDLSGFFEGTSTVIKIPKNTTKIRDDCFNARGNSHTSTGEIEYYVSLTSVLMPDSVTSIGKSAFYLCENLALTSLPSSLTSIGGYAFCGCKNLALTSLPEGLTIIGEQAFRYCPSLAITSIPSSVTTIGDLAFHICTGLTEITFEGTPNSINSSVFNGCTNLKTIRVPWSKGEVAGAPWSATNATIVYNYTATE